MKTRIIVAILFMCTANWVNGQSVLEKLKDKVKGRAEQRVDEGMDKGLDKIEEEARKKGKSKGKKKEMEKVENHTASNSKPEPKSTNREFQNDPFQSYSRYDFVPGENIVYAEDFSQDVIGEFPLKWTTNNRGEVVTVKGNDAKWLRMYQGDGRFVSPGLKRLPENFTLEFDLILHFDKGGFSYVYPDLHVMLLSLAQSDANAKNYLMNDEAAADLQLTIHPNDEGSSTIMLRSQKNKSTHFFNDEKGLKKLDSYYGKPIHFAFWIQKQRLRCWINGEKVYDIPQAVPAQTAYNRLAFMTGSSGYEDEQMGFYVTNIQIAEGTPDMRSKLITEGRLVTNGILFDVNSDKIKPQSAGVLREIASALIENSGVKVKIVGHTDSDGDDSKNLDLSKRRAASVKQALAKEFGIDASRMETDGLGESKPVADNTTKEGKAKNRRVEFIKL